GAFVAFASSRDRGSLAESNLWIVAARGGPARRLSRSPAVERDPRWTTDSRALVFASNLAGTFDLYRLDLVPGPDGPVGAESPVRISSGAGDEIGPTVSPDGRTVVYMAVDRATGRSHLERMDLA